MENNSNVIILDSNAIIDDFFVLTEYEKDLLKGFMVHESMRHSGLKMENNAGDFKRLYSRSPGIYMIYSISDEQVYIGQSTDVKERVYGHVGKLRNLTHRNPPLLISYIEHGAENFLFLQLEIVDDVLALNQREHFWIELYSKHYEQFNSLPAPVSKKAIMEICADINVGLTTAEIAESYDIPLTMVMDIRSGRRWEKIGRVYLSEEIREEWWNKENWSQFTEEEIIDICNLLNQEVIPHLIAKKHNCSVATIKNVRAGRGWRRLGEKHLNGEVRSKWWDKEPLRTLTRQEAVLICNDLNDGISSVELAERYGFSLTTINRLRRGAIWRKVSKSVLSDKMKEKWWDKEPQTRFQEVDVVEICEKLNNKTSISDVADEYGCSDTIIKHIRRGKVWKEVGEIHLSEEIKEKYWTTKPRRLLSEDEVIKICKELNKGTSAPTIAKSFGCLSDTITDIRRGKKWRKVGEINLSPEVKRKHWKN